MKTSYSDATAASVRVIMEGQLYFYVTTITFQDIIVCWVIFAAQKISNAMEDCEI